MRWYVTKNKLILPAELMAMLLALKRDHDKALIDGYDKHRIRDFYLIRFLAETGLRVSEVAKLVVGDYLDGTITVINSKHGVSRSVILAKTTIDMIEHWLHLKSTVMAEPTSREGPLFCAHSWRPMAIRTIRERVKQACLKAKLRRDISCHSFRHLYATTLMQIGQPITSIRDNLGHSSIAVTDVYSHLVDGTFKDIEFPWNKK